MPIIYFNIVQFSGLIYAKPLAANDKHFSKGGAAQLGGCCRVFCMFAVSAQARAAGISAMRIGQGVGSVRIVFDADRKFDYKVFLLSEPRRLVVDVFNVPVSSKIEKTADKK